MVGVSKAFYVLTSGCDGDDVVATVTSMVAMALMAKARRGADESPYHLRPYWSEYSTASAQ